ncbi:transposase [Streptomyces sp. NPDC002692]
MFELTDAVLCTGGPVTTILGLAPAPRHRRGHGAVYGALNRARLDVERLQTELAGLPLAGRAGARVRAGVTPGRGLRGRGPPSCGGRSRCPKRAGE